MHCSPYELWWWINGTYYRLANETGKTRTFQRGVLDHDRIMLQSSVAASFLFFKYAWASVTILGNKLIFWGKKLWNKTLHEEEENINGWNNYARILNLFWLLKWLLYMLRELIIVNLFQFTNMAAPRGLVKTVIPASLKPKRIQTLEYAFSI